MHQDSPLSYALHRQDNSAEYPTRLLEVVFWDDHSDSVVNAMALWDQKETLSDCVLNRSEIIIRQVVKALSC